MSSAVLSVSIQIVNQQNPGSISQTDIIKKTTNSNADIAEDDEDYNKYKVENIPINWDQYWRKPNSSIPIPSGFISTDKVEHRTKYIAPMKANHDTIHDETSGLSFWLDTQNSSVTVEWKNATVRDLPSKVPFTFRARIW